MTDTAKIVPYNNENPDEIFDLILPIQQKEFGIAITRDDQVDLANISSYYQQGNGNFWLARRNGTVVGTIALKDIGHDQLALRKMFVGREERGEGRGTARALLDAALAWARSRKCTDIFLGTTAQFLAAHRFYEKNGFVEVSKDQLPPSFPVMGVDTKFYRFKL